MPPTPLPRRTPLLRIPYTDPLPAPTIIPASASTCAGAIAALAAFLRPSLTTPSSSSSPQRTHNGKTLVLSGAGISVASGLADYRGAKGTYTLNRTYRPIYFHEFCSSHEARKRYWARSFLGWRVVEGARPNAAHEAVGRLGELGVVGGVITQNVDALHPLAHPHLPTLALHGSLATLTCLTCHTPHPRSAFQSTLAALNPTWSAFLRSIHASRAPAAGLKTNPDGDIDVPGAQYTSFKYPACPACLARGDARVRVDADGAWVPGSGAGVLKPGVVMFGESIDESVKRAAEEAVDGAGRVLVVGTSLATYSAWRLVRRAREGGVPVGVVNVGGVRGEEGFFGDGDRSEGVRIGLDAGEVLPGVVEVLEREVEEGVGVER